MLEKKAESLVGTKQKRDKIVLSHKLKDKKKQKLLTGSRKKLTKRDKPNTEGKEREKDEWRTSAERELRLKLRINVGGSPPRTSLQENQDVVGGSNGRAGREGGRIQFHSTNLLSLLHLLNPGNMFHRTCPATHAADAVFKKWLFNRNNSDEFFYIEVHGQGNSQTLGFFSNVTRADFYNNFKKH